MEDLNLAAASTHMLNAERVAPAAFLWLSPAAVQAALALVLELLAICAMATTHCENGVPFLPLVASRFLLSAAQALP